MQQDIGFMVYTNLSAILTLINFKALVEPQGCNNTTSPKLLHPK